MHSTVIINTHKYLLRKLSLLAISLAEILDQLLVASGFIGVC